MRAEAREILICQTDDGREPFSECCKDSIQERERGSAFGSIVWKTATSVTCSQSEKAYQNYESTSALATACTSGRGVCRCTSCSVVRNKVSRRTSLPRKRSGGSMMKTRLYREALDEALNDPDEAKEYLNAAMEDSPEAFLKACRTWHAHARSPMSRGSQG